jgi:hypothetical protein
MVRAPRAARPADPGGVDDGQRGFGIGQEMCGLGHGIAGVDRQEDDAGAQAGKVKRQDRFAFLDLQQQPVALCVRPSASRSVGQPAVSARRSA